MPNKLTDTEIKKALEEYINFADFEYTEYTSIRLDILKNALDLINRQEAEIKHLDIESDIIRADVENLNRINDELNAENESLKAEVERLKEDIKILRVSVEQAPQREANEHKTQIGDVLYENSYSYGKVFEWKVLDIWLENYIGGNKTIVKCSNGTWTKEFFAVDVLQFHKTKEEAEQKLKELKSNANDTE